MTNFAASGTEVNEKAYRKIINSWAMYDWANSAFAEAAESPNQTDLE